MPTLQKIYPEYIRRDGDTQPRASIDRATCNEYHGRMKAGEKFPPIDVYFDGKDYWLVDGFHRIEAYALALPGEPIECNVFEGNVQDAQWHSYSVNKTHGLPRKNHDKVRVVLLALQHPRSKHMSNRQIADYCGVGETMVRAHREESTAQRSAVEHIGRLGWIAAEEGPRRPDHQHGQHRQRQKTAKRQGVPASRSAHRAADANADNHAKDDGDQHAP